MNGWYSKYKSYQKNNKTKQKRYLIFGSWSLNFLPLSLDLIIRWHVNTVTDVDFGFNQNLLSKKHCK